jgi:hypothetical protein
MTTEPPLSELFLAICQWCERLGGAPLDKHDGCWEHALTFRGIPALVSINGHTTEHPSRDGMSVPSFHALVSINGWPAVLCSPVGGILMGGRYGDEDALIEAFNSTEESEG